MGEQNIEWILCPICGNKIRNKIREDTELKNFPLSFYIGRTSSPNKKRCFVKLITYASGKAADVIIWVVKHAGEEHKEAIEWLNNHTNEKIVFFLCEIKLYCIGISEPAVKFEVIEKPNDWTKEFYYEYHISKLFQFRNIQRYISENEEKKYMLMREFRNRLSF